jgi:ribosomal protein S18 acetylase RimI-like enzyme
LVAKSGIDIRSISGKEETGEVSKLASATGSEEPEIEEMISRDKIFVAKRKGKTIGYIALKTRKEENTMEISGLATMEDERGKGIAHLLIKHAEKTARSMKAKKLVVRTSNDNIPALALYQENGFKISEVRLGALVQHHGGKEVAGWKEIPVRDEVILEKPLRGKASGG